MPAALRAIDRLKVFSPNFVSVTYGAGGTTRTLTEEMVVWVKEQTGLVAMAHMTCVGQTREEVHGVLKRLEGEGIANVIALRGDPPRGEADFVPAVGGFSHATELICHLRENFDFGVAAACYPEGHTESPDLGRDLEFTRLKVEKGAEYLISQLFYDNSHFFNFLDRARKVGIKVPIIAGVLPILNAAQIRRFTSLCGATIPKDLDRNLDRMADDEEAVRELGIEYATDQVRELWEAGVDGIHFYALNRSRSISRILSNLKFLEPAHVPLS